MNQPSPPAAKRPPQTFAAIDLGSNSFHMIVCRLNDGELQVEDKLREMVRLGAGLDAQRFLDEETQERALACLERFGQRIEGIHPSRVRAVGTNTLRTARNASEFLGRAEQALGQPIEIIAGTEEARLIYLGVAHSTGADTSRRFVMDIGGGSTELIIGEGFEPQYMQSLYMGCVSFTRAHFGEGRITAKAVKRAELAALVELEPVQQVYRSLGWERALGASGTIRAIRTVVQAEGWCKEGITLKALKALREAMLAAGHIDKLQLKGLSAERAPVFPGGVMVLLATFKALGIGQMQVSDGALREGLIHDLLGRVSHEDVRARAVANLAKRYHVDTAHAERVAETAGGLLDQVAEAWKLEREESRQWLAWGAQLHEIGLDIAHSGYHKHGAYIAEFADLAGFSRQEQLVLACLIRNHRRKISSSSFKRLASHRLHAARHWMVLLRLAALLHRSRSPEAPPEPQLKAGEEKLKLRFAEGWLDAHQLTRTDLELEAGYLQAAGFGLKFA